MRRRRQHMKMHRVVGLGGVVHPVALGFGLDDVKARPDDVDRHLLTLLRLRAPPRALDGVSTM